MPEKSDASLDKEQEKNSPQIEEEILELLEGDMRETALKFATYLRANKLTPQQWFGPSYWRVPYEKDYLCGIVVNQDRWRVWFFTGDYSGELDEGFIKAVQGSVGHCISCIDDCPKGKAITIFGKDYTDTCCQFPVQFENPHGSTLEYIKELIEYWKGVAPRSDSWHAH